MAQAAACVVLGDEEKVLLERRRSLVILQINIILENCFYGKFMKNFELFLVMKRVLFCKNKQINTIYEL